MKINWGKVLEFALETGVTIGLTEKWLDEKIIELADARTQNAAMVEIAYEVTKMSKEQWDQFIIHLNVKANRNKDAVFLYNYCNYVVNLENNRINNLLNDSLQDAYDILVFDVQKGMGTVECAATYGILSARGEKSSKAHSLTQAFGRYLLNG